MKKDKLLTIILVIIFTIIGTAIGWFGNNILLKNEKTIDEKVEEKDDKHKEDKEGKWENIELDDKRFINIYNTLKGFTYDRSRAAGYKDFTNNELANLAFATAKVEKSDFTQISIENEGSITKSSFNTDIITKEINKIFNKNIEIDFNKIKSVDLYNIYTKYRIPISDNYVSGCGFSIDSYDKNSKKIVANFNTGGCGGTSGPSAKITERKIISARKNDDTIEVTEKAIYIDNRFFNPKITYAIYSDPVMMNYIDSVSYTEEEVTSKSINIDSYINKASTIVHTFKLDKSTNNYYFEKSIIL